MIKGHDHAGSGINFLVDMNKRMKSPVGKVKRQFAKALTA